MYTPYVQLNACTTSGTTVLRRPPKIKALIGTPCGFSQSASITGLCPAGAVKRAFACAAVRPQSGVQSLPVQSIRCVGAVLVMPSHHTSPSSVNATLVKMVLRLHAAIAFGFDRSE